MTVQDLIEELSKLPPTAQVVVHLEEDAVAIINTTYDRGEVGITIESIEPEEH